LSFPAPLAGWPLGLGLRLDLVGVDDRLDEAWETALDFRAAGGIAQFDTEAFAANQARLAQRFEMLRECRFRDALLAYGEEIRTILRAFRADEAGVDGDADGIGESVENGLDRNVFNRRMKERPHAL